MYTWCVLVCVLLTSCARAAVRVRTGAYTQFLGIPYAEVNHTDPFGPAKTYPYFGTPYSAFDNPPICPQIVDGEPQGNIHCLRLNIYTPNDATANSTLPVMVYVHGGSCIEGDGNVETYSPTFLVRNNVILVTVNYRLGPYGFLCLPQLGYSNQGLKDIVLALKWIKDHINGFGGDEDNILLFGHSSGSMLVDTIFLYNEDNVFNKVILQSGNFLSPFLLREPAGESYVASIAEKLGIDTKNLKIEDVMRQLSNANPYLVINATRNHEFRPCLDEKFIKKTPRKENLVNKKIIIGTTTKEMICFYRDEKPKRKRIEEEIGTEFVGLPKEALDEVKNFYLKDDLKDNIIDFGTDFVFNYPVERSVRYYLENNATVFRYLFSYDGGRNFVKVRDGIAAKGAAHADDLGYIFDMDLFRDVMNAEDEAVVNTMTSFWTNFAKYGNPTPAGCVVMQPRWPQFERRSKYYMHIGSSLSAPQRPSLHKMLFWDRFYHLYGKYSTGLHFGEEYITNRATLLRASLSSLFILIIKLFI